MGHCSVHSACRGCDNGCSGAKVGSSGTGRSKEPKFNTNNGIWCVLSLLTGLLAIALLYFVVGDVGGGGSECIMLIE